MRKKCTYCGAEKTQYSYNFDCGTFWIGYTGSPDTPRHERGKMCYERELEQLRAENERITAKLNAVATLCDSRYTELVKLRGALMVCRAALENYGSGHKNSWFDGLMKIRDLTLTEPEDK